MGEPAVAATVTDDTQERQTVLLVDDNATNLQVLYQTLKDLGPRVLIARSGETALSIVRETVPDLVLLDIMMPGMDGYEVCRQLQADTLTRSIPVVFVTGHATEEEQQRGLAMGAVAYLSKPVAPQELLSTVERILDSL
jgi:sigma-B regulation protein RsbU (phosphoserine phosphatase)